MRLGIVIPLVVLPIVLVGAFVWYRRSIANMAPSDAMPVSGLRLTAEALHRTPSPPWRIVYEVSGALGEIDHVAIGPPGVIAITTVVADRPSPAALIEARGEAVLVSEAAISRGPIEELLRAVAVSCDLSARVFWGMPAPERPAAEPVVHGSALVEGQRLDDWLTAAITNAPVPLEQHRIDEIWSTIVIGIGRPDPRS